MVQEITFAQWLKSRRKNLDLTQQVLAARVNCSVETIYKIEAGQRRPSNQIAQLLGQTLNIPTSELDAFVKFARSQEATRLHTHRVEVTPWRDAFIPNNNLPLQLTPLLGRDEHLTVAQSRLQQEAVRLLTILGPPGIGKTRLAIQLGNEMLLDFADGVYFVELASLTHRDWIVPAIAQVLDIAIAGHKKPLDSLQKFLYERQVLLILDNFEHLLEAADDIHSILSTCPLVKIVVTSRAPLRIRGEHQFPAEPLALPSRSNDLIPHRLINFPAVRLFVERAQAVHPQFELTSENAVTVATICSKLDGLPLAIEIVATQVAILGPTEILDHLTGERLLESQGMVDSSARHQTLDAAILWSYQLLGVAEQTFLRRLGVFVGGCTLESAQSVCQPKADIVQVLRTLVNANLLKRATDSNDSSYYFMLETIREFARKELQAKGEWQDTRDRHATYFHDFVLKHEASVEGKGQAITLQLLEREHPNLQLALDTYLETEVWDRGLELAGAMIHFWVYRNHLTIGLHYLTQFLTATENDSSHQAKRARALNGAAMMSYFAGDYGAVVPYSEAALHSAKVTNNHREIMWACTSLGMANGGMGQFDDAIAYFEQGQEASLHTDAPWELASLLNGLGEVARSQNRYEDAMAYYQVALPIARETENQWLLAHILDNVGHTAYSQRQYDTAYDFICQSMEASITLEDERGIAMCLEKIAWIWIAQELYHDATQLLGTADVVRKAKNTPIEGMDAEDYERILANLQSQLPPDTFEKAWQVGSETHLTQIIDRILSE